MIRPLRPRHLRMLELADRRLHIPRIEMKLRGSAPIPGQRFLRPVHPAPLAVHIA